MFKLKDKNIYPSSIIYKGVCSCGVEYEGETQRIAEVRWREHEDKKLNSEPSKHLKRNPEHVFTWSIRRKAPLSKLKRKILEALFISRNKPSLNNQINHVNLILFRNGIT